MLTLPGPWDTFLSTIPARWSVGSARAGIKPLWNPTEVCRRQGGGRGLGPWEIGFAGKATQDWGREYAGGREQVGAGEPLVRGTVPGPAN